MSSSPPAAPAADPAAAPPPPPAAAELSPRDRKLKALESETNKLEQILEELTAAHSDSLSRLRNPEGKGTDTVQRHIALLHDYNEVRDVALGLMGIVAERRGVGVGTVMKEFGLDPRGGGGSA